MTTAKGIPKAPKLALAISKKDGGISIFPSTRIAVRTDFARRASTLLTVASWRMV